ncbi:MAG: right-handed parallel beta-helix repeat-containing protein, partial [Pirellulales bacterium]
MQTVDADQTLTIESLSGEGNDGLTDIEAAILSGGPRKNTFDLTSWLGAGVVSSAGGLDELLVAGDGDFTLTPSLLARSAAGNITIAAIHSVRISAGAGANRIDASAFTGPVSLLGGSGDDVLLGGSGDDYLDAGIGTDQVFAGPGDDVLNGGGGAGDWLDAGPGDDIVYGSDDGGDIISGGAGRDRLHGLAGNDTLSGGLDADTIDAGPGDDVVSGGEGGDLIVGGAHHDVLYGHSADGLGDDNAVDYLYGDFGTGGTEPQSGQDRIYGGGGNDLLFGEGGDDFIDAGSELNNLVDFGAGESANPSDFNAPIATAPPLLLPATEYTPVSVLLPSGLDYASRWQELARSATGDGLTGGAGRSLEPSIAAGFGGRYVAWADDRSGNFEIYVARHSAAGWESLGGSTTGGGVSATAGESRRPSIALDATGQPIVAWTEVTAGATNIRAARWDAGANAGAGAWSALGSSASPGGISGTGTADHASVVITAAGPNVVWLDHASGVPNVFARRFDGSAWVAYGAGADGGGGLSGSSVGVSDLAVATDGSRVAVAWSEVGAQPEIFLREYSSGTWRELDASATGAGISATSGASRAPSVAYLDGDLFVAWQETTAGDNDIRVKRFLRRAIGGPVWSSAGSGSASGGGVSQTGEASSPELASGGGVLHLAWRDDLAARGAGQGTAIYDKRWDGVNFVEEVTGDASLTGIAPGAWAETLALTVDSARRPFVASQDGSFGSADVHVRGNLINLGQKYFVNDGDIGGDVFTTSPSTTGAVVTGLNDGLTTGTPQRSLASILTNYDLGPGDSILVDAGLHSLTTHGLSGEVRFTAADSGVLVIGPPDRSAVLSGVVVVEASAQITLENITIAGGLVVRSGGRVTLIRSTIQGDGITLEDSGQLHLVHSVVDADAAAIIVNGNGAEVFAEHNEITGDIVIESGANIHVVLRHNRITGDQTAVALIVPAFGEISGNDISMQVARQGTALRIGSAFSGPIADNDLHGAAIGVDYAGAAALARNRIYDNTTGVRARVADLVTAFGFVPGSAPNEIYLNVTGVSLAGRVRGQHVFDNTTGVSGAGTLGGDDLDQANVIEGNATGVNVSGAVQFNRIAQNTIGIRAATGQTLTGNLIYRNTQSGLLVSGQSDAHITNNTFFAPQGDNIRVEAGARNVEVTGNILWAESGYDIYVANDSQVGFASDENTLHATDGGRLVYWTRDFSDILDWQAEVARFDLHSIGRTSIHPDWSEPRFADRARDDYRVLGLVAGQRFSSPTVDASGATSGMGANGTLDGGREQGSATRVALRYPDLYTDWERGEPGTIRWQTYGNTTAENIRIDLYQDGPDGPAYRATIAAATADDGEFAWSPQTSGVDFATHGLRIQVSLVSGAGAMDRGAEPFSVPEDGNDYFADDASDEGDEYTPSAVGSNRNTGKAPSAPKPNPVNLLRVYALTAGDELRVDTGDYPLIDPIRVSGAIDVGLGIDEGFGISGPAGAGRIARLTPAIPGQRTWALVELNNADFVTVANLTLSGAQRGYYAHGGSDQVRAHDLVVSGHALEGIRVETSAVTADWERLTAMDNGATGIWISGPIASLTQSTAAGNFGTGITLTSPGAALVADNLIHGNRGDGFVVHNAQGTRVEHNQIYGNLGRGVSVSASGPTTIIGHDDLSLGRGNIVHDNGEHGISAGGTVRIVGNTVYGHAANGRAGIDAFGAEQIVSNVVYGNDVGILSVGGVMNNRVYQNRGVGIVTGASGRVTGNVVYSNGAGIQVGCCGYYNAAELTNNLIYGNTTAGIRAYSGDGLKVINNTVHQPAGNALIFEGETTRFTMRNNIFSVGAGYAVNGGSFNLLGLASDFNDFYVTGAGQVGLWQGVARPTLARWRSATFTDATSVSQDPLFIDADGADNVLGYASATTDGRDDDFHLESLYGSSHGGSLAPVVNPATGLPSMLSMVETIDGRQSPLIDRGAATDAFASEPLPNGGYINIGAYGNTSQASKSPATYLRVLTPNGGEAWPAEQMFAVRWRSNDPLEAVTVDIELLQEGNPAPVLLIADNTPNDGEYFWPLPETLPAAANYVIRVTRTDNGVTDSSDVPFTVTPPVHNYYVNDVSVEPGDWTTAAGDETNDGLSPDRPKASLRAILETYDLELGDTIFVDAGTHLVASNVTIGAGDSGVRIEGYHHETFTDRRAVLDRGALVGGNHVIELVNADDVTLDHLSLTGGNLAVYAASGSDSDRLTLSNNDIYGYGHGVWLENTNDQA